MRRMSHRSSLCCRFASFLILFQFFFSKISFPTSPICLIREGRQQPNYYAPVPRSETASLFFFFKTKIVCCFSLWKSSKGSQNKKQRVYAFCFLLMLFILFDQIRGSGAFYGSNCCYLLKPITDRPSLMPFGSSISSYTVQLMAKILTWQFDAFVFRYIFTIASYSLFSPLSSVSPYFQQ